VTQSCSLWNSTFNSCKSSDQAFRRVS